MFSKYRNTQSTDFSFDYMNFLKCDEKFFQLSYKSGKKSISQTMIYNSFKFQSCHLVLFVAYSKSFNWWRPLEKICWIYLPWLTFKMKTQPLILIFYHEVILFPVIFLIKSWISHVLFRSLFYWPKLLKISWIFFSEHRRKKGYCECSKVWNLSTFSCYENLILW